MCESSEFLNTSKGQMVRGFYYEIFVLQPVDHYLQCNLSRFKMSPQKTIQNCSKTFKSCCKSFGQFMTSKLFGFCFPKLNLTTKHTRLLHEFVRKLHQSDSSCSKYCCMHKAHKFLLNHGYHHPLYHAHRGYHLRQGQHFHHHRGVIGAALQSLACRMVSTSRLQPNCLQRQGARFAREKRGWISVSHICAKLLSSAKGTNTQIFSSKFIHCDS